MNFKLTKWKVIVTIMVLIIWYLFLIFSSFDCRTISVYCPIECEEGFTILPKCCECIPFTENFKDFILIITPGILMYFIWSLAEKKKKKKK